jgi:hypothetical protein
VERVYLLTPATPELERRADRLQDPTMAWRGGLIMPVPERQIGDLQARGYSATVIFPAAGPFLGALADLTRAQLEVELAERAAAPGFAGHVAALRLEQATLRAAVHLIVGADPRCGRVLMEQTREEAERLGEWSSSGAASGGDPAALARELSGTLGDARLLAALCRSARADDVALRLDALTRSLTHVADHPGGL